MRLIRLLIATWLTSLTVVASCGPRKPALTPTADVVKLHGPWSYCEPPAHVSLARANEHVIESHVLHARANTQYDLLIVPGYTPDNPEKPLGHVHPILAARLDQAVALYRQAKSHLVLVAGGNVHPVDTPYNEALTMKAYLLEQGLPESAIVVEPCARHSTTNLRNAGRFMLKYHLRTALVVTSPDQAFYFANGNLSTFDLRSRAQLGYVVGTLNSVTPTTLEFAPNAAVMQRGPDPLDP